jgi:hypothetical protein
VEREKKISLAPQGDAAGRGGGGGEKTNECTGDARLCKADSAQF